MWDEEEFFQVSGRSISWVFISGARPTMTIRAQANSVRFSLRPWTMHEDERTWLRWKGFLRPRLVLCLILWWVFRTSTSRVFFDGLQHPWPCGYRKLKLSNYRTSSTRHVYLWPDVARSFSLVWTRAGTGSIELEARPEGQYHPVQEVCRDSITIKGRFCFQQFFRDGCPSGWRNSE